MSNFWDWFWTVFLIFAFTAYLFAIFTIVIDLFRDKTASGWAKAIWMIFLIFLPMITAIVYLIARGGGMAERSMAEAQTVKAAQDDYIRSVATTSPAEQVAKAKELLDAGTITQAEFDALKAKALA
ncbi:SHOCT domain-containing protein [Actinotalea sp. M2MS4P-6]|uniref:SHOCT domain-containing protein n=1 Tax=Actinotalea sp. M2MS4P-6 TaxID=2983762 RepID=UPI0021E3D108|nr:SHOCT domain-containing protein [Actinotalea sp. M2MS4P-6]MCV2395234.1 SHOCT domain-containing protein [Actinotalea sp. M2MS4P-6]